MGCRLSGPWMGDGMGVGGRDLSHLSKRDLAHLSKRDALRILAAYEHPITMQIKGHRGRGLQDCSTQTDRSWEPLPLNLQHLNLPLRSLGVTAGTMPRVNSAYQDRHYCSHLSLPRDHRDNGRYEYLPNAPRDIEDIDPMGYQDPELASPGRKGQSCLVGCCNSNLDEPGSFHSQTEDEDCMLEKPMGYLPLHHELDSGLGWTDGSLHQGDLSGLETEEGGLEECHPHGGLVPGGLGPGMGGGSPSSESFISSELSDSGFYSVSTGEFRRFQRLLEKRMRLYNARLHHQGEPCERRERRDSCPKNHRELLEAIPEALTIQPQHQCPPHGMGGPGMGPHSRGLFRVSSVQFRKADRPSLNRHSSSSGSLFNPSHAPLLPSGTPVLSTCSTPSGHRRPLAPIQPQHQGSSSVGVLRRSRTLHHRPPPQEYRRRASHPASPTYCAATMHHCGGVVPPGGPELGLPEEGELEPGPILLHPAGLAVSPQQHPTALGEHRGSVPLPHGPCYDNSANRSNNVNHASHCHQGHHDRRPQQERSFMTELPIRERDREREMERQREMERERQMQRELEIERERERQIQRDIEKDRERQKNRERAREKMQRFHTISHPSQQSDIHETWPKPASRQSHGSGGGLYSTLEGHIGSGPVSGDVSRRGIQNQNQNQSPNPLPHPNPNPNPGQNPTQHPNPNPNSRVSRNQLLRDRASRLADERSGMSTDEETNADMFRGRYWSRTERREHLLLAREHKQQHQQQQQQQQQHQARGGGATREGAISARGTPVGGGGGAVGGEGGVVEGRGGGGGGTLVDGRCNNTVLELSHRKLSRLRNRKLLDDWTTVEELLTHGNRLGSGEEMLCPSSLLTVTTV
ncbi:uncharacterized protein FYW47_018842 [Aplochiton taeniatus]